MNRSLLWRTLLIVFVVGWAAYSMFPLKNRPLGEVFQEKLARNDDAMKEVLKKFKELHAQNPQNDFKNLYDAASTNDLSKYFDVDVTGEKDVNAAVLKRLQRDAAGKIKLGLDLQGGSSFLVELQTDKLATNISSKAAVDNAVEVLRKRVDKFGVAEPVIQPVGENRIQIQMPGLSEAEMESVRVAITKAAFLEFRMVHEESAKLLEQGITPPGYVIMKETKNLPNGQKTVTPFLVSKQRVPGLSGKNIKSAGVIRGNMNDPQISFHFDGEGASVFGRVTTENVGKQLAIILDNELYSAPFIRTPITEGTGVISGGQMSEKDAFDLASILQNPLEAPLKVIAEEKVDPTLGKDTISSGINSAIYATIAVALFMAVYYLFAGVVANVALLLNIVVLLGIMAMRGMTLTLPGIAGIVLTVGMAVDANVLIFERIREELAKGKSLKGALAAGYSRAFGTIFDSHVTTLISSIILIWFGTGTIQGFGWSLTIGVAASLFTALVVTRVVFDFMLHRNLIKGMPMLRVIGATKVDFMKFAKPAFVVSWLIILVGVSYGVYRGPKMLGIDFTGGDNMTFAFKQKLDVEQIRTAIKPVAADAVIQYQRPLVGTEERLRITAPYDTADKIEATLKPQGFELIGSERVGPIVGEEILRSAVIATLLSLLGILVYVAFRYEFSFAVGAVIAVLHDVFMTVGIYSLTGFFGEGRQLNATMVAALLTIIGFSINDTIVIFDRIREDLKMGVRGTFREIINTALNQTLSRTIITSGTVFLATMALFVFGGGAINDFAFTFLAGIITGTYSSIFIAASLVLWWHKGQRPAIASQVVMTPEAVPAKA